jgi:hypothetical protein
MRDSITFFAAVRRAFKTTAKDGRQERCGCGRNNRHIIIILDSPAKGRERFAAPNLSKEYHNGLAI